MIMRADAGRFDGASQEMREAFAADGVIVLEGLIAPERCRALVERMGEIIAAFDFDAHRATFQSSGADDTHEDHLLDSARDIRFFFEDEALGEDGQLLAPGRRGLNKVGHALHDKDPVYRAFSRQTCFRQIAEGLGLAQPLLLQSMHIFKPPHIGGEVASHQDATYLWTEPQSCLGMWVALEDATVDNGCLWGIPGMHREAHPRSRWRRRGDGAGAVMDVLDDRDWPEADCVPLEATCGTVIVFDGQFPHRSSANRSDRSREAYTLHVIDGTSHYPRDNWLQWTGDDPITGFELD